MPFAIDEKRFREQTTFDVSAAPNSPTGIPMKQIPHMDFPRCMYKHPLEPFRTIIHRNAQHEIVDQEVVANEHKVMLVKDEAEMKSAMAEGWKKEAYIPADVKTQEDDIYGTPVKAAKK